MAADGGLLAAVLQELPRAATLDVARGIEGETAKTYFGAFSHMVRHHRDVFRLGNRSRRPPRDPVNALLSFVYALVRHDCEGALQSVGLDPAVGYLHVDRPGRPSLSNNERRMVRKPATRLPNLRKKLQKGKLPVKQARKK